MSDKPEYDPDELRKLMPDSAIWHREYYASWNEPMTIDRNRSADPKEILRQIHATVRMLRNQALRGERLMVEPVTETSRDSFPGEDYQIFFDELRNVNVAIPLYLIEAEDEIIEAIDPPFYQISVRLPDGRILFHFVPKGRWQQIRDL